MKMKFNYWLFIILFFSTHLLFGQETVVEEIGFELAKTIYFTDEKIWVEGEVVFGENSPNSKLLYFEFLDQAHRSWGLAKLPLRDGVVSNFIEIPDDIPSGNYLLRSFTRISAHLDLEKGIAQQLVTILNPQIPPKLGESTESISASITGSAPVLMKAETIAPGKTSALEILIPLGQVQSISLSISNPYLPVSSQAIASSEIYTSLDSDVFLPELFGHIIHAKVDQMPVDTLRTYFLSVHGKESALFTDRADASGDLFFDLGGFKYWDYILIQDALGESMAAVEIQSPAPKTKFKSNFVIPELRISKEQETFLRQLKRSSAIAPYFTQTYGQELFPVVTGFVADQVYLLDDYTRFETVETTLKEYVLNVMIRRKDRRKEFRLLNVPEDYLFQENPLIMIDALPVFDSDALAGYNPKLFSKIEVLNRTFFLNDQEYDGVLSISSYANDFGLFPIPNEVLYLDYPGENSLAKLNNPIYSKPSKDDRIPDLRTTLYWYSKTGSDQPLSKEIEFTASEMRGSFELKIVYLDSSGQEQTWSTFISVED